uniref:C-type lectin domain-containing protein n=1 Tax=Oryzias latipes TaxID=8090 RepID=A0A3B3ID10_ORYLA
MYFSIFLNKSSDVFFSFSDTEGEAAPHCRLFLPSLGILSTFLLTCIIIIIIIRSQSSSFDTNLNELKLKKKILETQTEELSRERDDLSWTLDLILSFHKSVPTKCPKDWIQFQESCYFFHNLNSPWKTWDESRQFCQSMKSDLVVISSLEEQTFIKNTIKYYYDTWHGYWIGLQKVNNNWIWVDGSPDTIGYWNNPESSENFALIIQNATLTQSWYITINGFRNRFICEIKALIF